MSDVSLFQSFDEGAANLAFCTAAGTISTSRAMGTVKFKAFDRRGEHRVLELYRSYSVYRYKLNLVAIFQLTRNTTLQTPCMIPPTSIFRPSGHKKVAKANKARFHDNGTETMLPAEQKHVSQHHE